MRFPPYFPLFYFNERLGFFYIFLMKYQKDKDADLFP